MTLLLLWLWLIVGGVVLALALPKWREVFIISVHPAETFDQIVFGIISILTVLGWPVVVLGWLLATLGRLLAR